MTDRCPPKPSPRVIAMLRDLPGKQGDVMQLYYRGFNDRQIGESLGMLRTSVRNMRGRTLNAIRRRLAQADPVCRGRSGCHGLLDNACSVPSVPSVPSVVSSQ